MACYYTTARKSVAQPYIGNWRSTLRSRKKTRSCCRIIRTPCVTGTSGCGGWAVTTVQKSSFVSYTKEQYPPSCPPVILNAMKPLWFLIGASLVVIVLIFMNNQQGLLTYIVRTFLHGGR